MPEKFIHFLKIARTMPVPLLIARSLSRLGFRPGWVKRIDFLYSEEVRRPDKTLKIIFDSLNAAGVSSEAFLASIPESSVLEVGCGRFVGLAPFVFGLGARRYVGVDPALEPDLFSSREIEMQYLRPAFDSAREFMKSKLSFSDLDFKFDGIDGVRHLISHSKFEQYGVENLSKTEECFDICVSVSCFEHIRDFSAAVATLSSITHPGTVHVHVVNFSNHLSKKDPFGQLYEAPYDEFGRRWSYNINGLRLSDLLSECAKVGLNLRAFPLDRRPNALPRNIHPFWLDRYDTEELSVRTALLTTL